MQPIDIHAERYRITTEDHATGTTATVQILDSDESYVADDLPTLREIVANLRDAGAARAESVTYRKALLASDAGGFYSATLARVYPDDIGEPGDFPSSYAVRDWGLPVNRENLRDPACRFLVIPYASEDPCGHDILGRVNRDALLELEGSDPYADPDGIGYVGGSTVLDIDTEAGPSVLEAIEGLEGYPVVDDDALSHAEMEEDEECWSDWGRADFARELESALDTDADITIEPGSDLDKEALEAVYEYGRPGGDGCDIEGAARRWILDQSARSESARRWNPSDDDVQAARGPSRSSS